MFPDNPFLTLQTSSFSSPSPLYTDDLISFRKQFQPEESFHQPTHHIIPCTGISPAVTEEPSRFPSTPFPGHLLSPLLVYSRTRMCLQKSPFLSVPNEPLTSAYSRDPIFRILSRSSLLSHFPLELLPRSSAPLCSNHLKRSYLYLLRHFQFLHFCSFLNSIHSGFLPPPIPLQLLLLVEVTDDLHLS